MKIIIQIAYMLLIFFIVFNKVSLKMVTEDYCEAEAEDDEAIVQWYSHIHNFAYNNQNISKHLIRIDEKLTKIENKLEICEKELLSNLQPQGNSNRQEIVIQRRGDGSENFLRTWDEYKQGFGNSSGEFFIGLEKIHKLTNTRPHELLIVMEDWENQRRYAKYDHFAIGSEIERYPLTGLGTYSGTAGDSLTYHLGFKFTTKDQDNDANGNDNCAVQYKGAWWHNTCHVSNLNGLYLKGPISDAEWAQGVVWKSFKGYTYSLKFVEMILIRS